MNSNYSKLSLKWLFEACMTLRKTRIAVVLTAFIGGHLEYCTILSFIMVKAVDSKSSHAFKVAKPSRSASNAAAVGIADAVIDGVYSSPPPDSDEEEYSK